VPDVEKLQTLLSQFLTKKSASLSQVMESNRQYHEATSMELIRQLLHDVRDLTAVEGRWREILFGQLNDLHAWLREQ
jgi:hypothetical protein